MEYNYYYLNNISFMMLYLYNHYNFIYEINYNILIISSIMSHILFIISIHLIIIISILYTF